MTITSEWNWNQFFLLQLIRLFYSINSHWTSLLNENEDKVAAEFEGDEPLNGIEEAEEAEEEDIQHSPEQTNTASRRATNSLSVKKKKTPKKSKNQSIETLLENLQIEEKNKDNNNQSSNQPECQEEMKIRHLDHFINLAPFDNVTFTQATRCMVITELPFGVSS